MSGSHSPMSVLPAPFGMRSGALFIKKCLPPSIPQSEIFREERLGSTGQRKRQCSEFTRRFGFRSSRQIFRNSLHLMKLAVLHRNAFLLKNACNTSFTVKHCSGNDPPCSYERGESFLIYPWGFKERFFPPEIFFLVEVNEIHRLHILAPRRSYRTRALLFAVYAVAR